MEGAPAGAAPLCSSSSSSGSDGGLLAVVLVSSARANADRRRACRNTCVRRGGRGRGGRAFWGEGACQAPAFETGRVLLADAAFTPPARAAGSGTRAARTARWPQTSVRACCCGSLSPRTPRTRRWRPRRRSTVTCCPSTRPRDTNTSGARRVQACGRARPPHGPPRTCTSPAAGPSRGTARRGPRLPHDTGHAPCAAACLMLNGRCWLRWQASRRGPWSTPTFSTRTMTHCCGWTCWHPCWWAFAAGCGSWVAAAAAVQQTACAHASDSAAL